MQLHLKMLTAASKAHPSTHWEDFGKHQTVWLCENI